MPALPQASMATWEITYRPDTSPHVTEEIKAAYPVGDDKLPGWTLMKDHLHQIVKMVPVDVVAAITRMEK